MPALVGCRQPHCGGTCMVSHAGCIASQQNFPDNKVAGSIAHGTGKQATHVATLS